jgi:trimeric autotransporter adhesin
MFTRTCLLFVFSCALALAQSFQGGIRGLVADTSGASVSSAKILLLNEFTGATLATLSTAEGEYVFNAVVPATYTLSAESPGFKRWERKGVIVATQQFLTIDAKLELGQVSESVMVTEDIPLIESSNASNGQVIDRQKLLDLPNLGRNAFMMSKLANNVVAVGNPRFNRMQDQSGSSQISIAGGPVRGNNYLLDGIPIVDSVNRAVIIPTLEGVQEVKVQANTYDAEMGRTGGGVFNTYLKSGGNEFHGSALGYMRQTEWLANNFFNNRAGLPVTDQPFRNYGGSIGGPVWLPKIYDGRNKTFFWAAGEAYRQTSSTTATFALPTAAEVNGDFSQSLARGGAALQTIYDPLTTLSDGAGGFTRQAFPGNRIPANRLNPVGLAIAKTYAAPQKTPGYHGEANYTANASLYDRADQLTFKADHAFTEWWRASASYLHYGSQEPGEFYLRTVSSSDQWTLGRKVDATQVNNIFTLNATTVLSVRYGFNRFPNLSSQQSAGFNLASLNLPGSFLSSVQSPTFPNVSMQNFANMGSNSNGLTVFHSKNLSGQLAKFIGKHSLKMGADYRRFHVDGINYANSAGQFTVTDVFTRATPLRATAGTGSDLASLLLGHPESGTAIQASKLFQYADYIGFYFHDDFRIVPKLTLNLGLRYEYETGLKAVNNALIVGFSRTGLNPIPVTRPAASFTPTGYLLYAGVDGNPTRTGNNNRNKLSPRVGIAYQLNGKTTLRGGYGMFWAPIPYSLQDTLGYSQTTPYVGSVDGNATPANSLSNPFPSGVLPIVGNANGQLAGVGQGISFIDQFHRSPLIHQYSFDVQRQLPGGIAMAAGYVGTNSVNLVLGSAGVNINQLAPEFLDRGSALSGTVDNPLYRAGGPGIIGSSRISLSQFLRPFPAFTAVTANNTSWNHALYHSLAMRAQKRMSNGLSFLATWTWSINKDGSAGGAGSNIAGSGAIQNLYNLEAEYGLAVTNTPHRFTSAVTYELPVGKGKAFLSNSKVLDLALGGWSLNAVTVYQSGYPIAITQNSNNNVVIGAAGQRPNATGASPVTAGPLMDRIDGYINPAAFSQSAPFTFGNVSRLIGMRGPGISSWDASVFKTFSVTEKLKAQFRAEALNAFNTPQFRNPNGAFGNANFGRITSQANFPRLIQLGVRFYF